jgi:hypothetical protein
MPKLDANTMSWLTGVIAPLLAALVAALVGSLGAIYGVRWEAGRAEDAAAKESLRRRRVEIVERTHENAITWLYSSATGALPETSLPLRPTPRALDWNVVDTDIRTRLVEFINDLVSRKPHNGLSREDIEKLTLLTQNLADASNRQLQRAEAGIEPLQYPPDTALLAALGVDLGQAKAAG